LRVETKRSKQISKEILDFNEIDTLLKRLVVAKYMKGCDEIEVHFDSLEKSRIVQDRVDELIGMEIVEQDRRRLLLKDIGGSKEENSETILRRILYLLHSISEESLEAFKKQETNLAYLEDMERNVNKFSEYCIRWVNKYGHLNSQKTAVHYCFLFLLEDLGDDYKKLISYIDQNKLKLSKSLIETYTEMNSYYQNLERLCLKFNLKKAAELANERDGIIKKIERKIADTRSTKEVVILKHFEAITDKIIKISGELATI